MSDVTEPHRDAALAPADRALALMAQMTVREKAQQLVGILPHSLATPDRVAAGLEHGIGHISGVNVMAGAPHVLAAANNAFQRFLVERTRLGIPAIVHNETLNGVLGKQFTSFPTPSGLAATWNSDLVGEMADLIRRQARSIGVTQALSPVLDIARDARWGRVHETYGEEVLLVTAMGVAFIGGLQGDDLADGVIATAKHFLAYGWTEGGQNLAATHLGPRELYDVYATPFEAAIALAGLGSVMNSYSEIDGEPVAASRAVLTDLLRGRLGFTGTVVSDYRTLDFLVDRQAAASDAEEAGALALHAGLDVELPGAFGYGATLAAAVEGGRIDETLLDTAVHRVLTQKFELGLFEAPFVSEDPIELEAIARDGGGIAADLAHQSLTMLRNDAVLPFDPAARRIAVVGPHADSALASFANYTYPASLEMMRGLATGQARLAGMEGMLGDMPPAMREAAAVRMEAMAAIDLDQVTRDDYGARSLADAVRDLLPDADVVAVPAIGVLAGDATQDDAGIADAVAAAHDADIVILALGGRSGAFAGLMTEGEGTDTADVSLPAHQIELARRVAAVGRPTAAVLFAGKPLAIAELDDAVPAILTAYYPGQAGTSAVARVLFGAASPQGKLPFTMPRATGQVPIYQSAKRGSGYRREIGDNFQRYADLEATPLYPFGHGLSYTSFAYGDLALEDEAIAVDGRIRARVAVRNTGDRSGVEVVQFYASCRTRGMTRPMQQLVGFARVPLEPGEERAVDVVIDMSQLGFSDAGGRFVTAPGTVVLMAGSSSDDIRARADLTVSGETAVVARRSYLPEVRVSEPRPAGAEESL
ncbi:glycoside hydrolase family 3 N-terminal domain-containing protein [Microbacterium sp. NPDC089189]|uniref:glycoside hydrolase family 3 N-terminal domain-containing protein n=1 Tax=Microbacterium sp. NPDC089189 TaxID=3154972 RepID=UPI003447B728